MRRDSMRFSSVVLAVGMLATASVVALAAPLAQQTSSERGVTLRATPRDLGITAKAWEFEIVLETHSQDLTDDLKSESTLVTDGGAKRSPTGWEGDPPGGHHRKGVLRFAPVTPPPQAIELLIQRPGETSPRSFRWQMK